VGDGWSHLLDVTALAIADSVHPPEIRDREYGVEAFNVDLGLTLSFSCRR
jgi:hypothetical protein